MRLKIKLSKLDQVIKVVNRRNSRRRIASSVNVTEPDERPGTLYYKKFGEISKQPHFIAYQTFQSQFYNEVVAEFGLKRQS